MKANALFDQISSAKPIEVQIWPEQYQHQPRVFRWLKKGCRQTMQYNRLQGEKSHERFSQACSYNVKNDQRLQVPKIFDNFQESLYLKAVRALNNHIFL